MAQSASLPIAVRELTKAYGAVHALDHVDLDVKSGEFLTLLGPSGSGKTTLLMVLAGFPDPDGPSNVRNTGGRSPGAAQARPGHGVSELCPLSAHERGRQHRLSAQVARHRQPRNRPPRRGGPRTRPAWWLRR